MPALNAFQLLQPRGGVRSLPFQPGRNSPPDCPGGPQVGGFGGGPGGPGGAGAEVPLMYFFA